MNLIIIDSLFILLIYLHYKFLKSKVTISLFFTVYWLIFVNGGILFFSNIYSFNHLGNYFIVLQCYLFFIGFFLLEYKQKETSKTYNNKFECKSSNELRNKLLCGIILLCFLAKITGVFVSFYLNGIDFIEIFNPSKFLDILNQLTLIRYEHVEGMRSMMTSLGNMLGYLGFIMLGYYFNDIKKYKNFLIIFSVIAILLGVIESAGKSMIIFAIILFSSAFLSSNILSNNMSKIVVYIKRNLVKILIIVIIVFTFLYLFILLRSGFKSSGVSILTLYGFGEIPAFDYYINNHITSTLGLGKHVFYGFLSTFGFGDPNFTLGVYLPIDLGSQTTNVFTAFRSVIDDFGLVGCGFFFLLLGALMSYIKNSIFIIKFKSIFVSLHCYIVAFILNSFNISIGNFFSISFSFVLFTFILEYFNNFDIYNKKMYFIKRKMLKISFKR